MLVTKSVNYTHGRVFQQIKVSDQVRKIIFYIEYIIFIILTGVLLWQMTRP